MVQSRNSVKLVWQEIELDRGTALTHRDRDRHLMRPRGDKGPDRIFEHAVHERTVIDRQDVGMDDGGIAEDVGEMRAVE